MTSKSTKFETNNDIEVAVTLSNSSRLSLSDITQATIGNLSEWADNSDRTTDTGGNVLRPWEDHSDTGNVEYVPATDTNHQVITKLPPPTYQEHIKRHLEEDTEDERSKRQRTTESSTLHHMPAAINTTESSALHHIPAAINSFYQTNSEMCKDRIITHNSPVYTQSHDAQSSRYTNNRSPSQDAQPSSYTNTPHVAENTRGSVNMNNNIPAILPTNSTEQVHQSYNPRQQLPALNIIVPTNQNSNLRQQNYLPWRNSQMATNQIEVNRQQQSYISPAVNQNFQQVQVVADQTQGIQFQQCLVTQQIQTIQPQLFQPYAIQSLNDAAVSPQVLPLYDVPVPMLLPSPGYTQQPQSSNIINKSNFQSNTGGTGTLAPNMTLVPPSLQQCEPRVNTSSSNQLMPKVVSSVTNTTQTETPFNLTNLRAAMGCDDNTINEHQAKQEPKTPVGKLAPHSALDSPGLDSRFTESLYNLLGSPPPDSPMSKNPIMGDLQALLNRECKKEILPQSLFRMQGSDNETVKHANLFERERNLQERFSTLQGKNSEEVHQLSSMFRYQSALIETDRFRTLHESQYPGSYKDSINRKYDNQLHKVMDRVERSLQLLETSNKENQSKKSIKFRPHLSKESVKLMENWYQQNLSHPYPTSHVIEMLAQAGNINVEQVKKWFANKRNRSSNTRSLTEIAMQKRKLGQMPGDLVKAENTQVYQY